MPTSVNARVWIALVTVYLVWGSTYLAIRVVVREDVPPLLGMGMRFTAAGLLLALIVGVSRGFRSLRINRAQFLSTAFMGAALILGGNGLVAVAEQTLPSGLAALIVGAVPLWFALLRVSGGERPSAVMWAGVLIGFAGIAVISLPRGGLDGVEWWGVVCIIGATLSWSIGSYLSARMPIPTNPLVATTYEMFTGGVIMTLVAGSVGEYNGFSIASMSSDAWLALTYLVFVGSLVGYTAYVYLLANAPLSLVGTYAFVNPVVAVLLGWLILDERVTSVVFAGGALVVVGVAMVVRSERKQRPDERSQPEPEPEPEALGLLEV